MRITLSPQRGFPGQPETTISVSGDILTVGGIDHDLSGVLEGGETIPQGEGHPFDGKITRQNGAVHATVCVRLGDDADPNQPTDPAHWIIPDAQGDVTIPALRKPEAEEGDV